MIMHGDNVGFSANGGQGNYATDDPQEEILEAMQALYPGSGNTERGAELESAFSENQAAIDGVEPFMDGMNDQQTRALGAMGLLGGGSLLNIQNQKKNLAAQQAAQAAEGSIGRKLSRFMKKLV